MDMGDIKGSLTKKVGPFPAWVYAVGLVAGGGIVWYLKRRNSANGTVTETVTDANSDEYSDDGYGTNPPTDGVGDTSGTVGAGGSTGGSTVSPPSTAPTTNAQWQSDATSYLIGFGYTASEVTQALNNWLLGLQATATDTALYNLAVQQYGLPPEGVPPQPVNTNPTPPGLPGGPSQPPGKPTPGTPKPPTTHEYYTVKSGDNLTKIAKKFDISESALYANNKSVIEAAAKKHGHSSSNDGNLIFAGTKLMIK